MPNGRRRRGRDRGQQPETPAAAPAGGEQPTAAAGGEQPAGDEDRAERARREARPRRQETGTQKTFWAVVDDHWDKVEKVLPWLAGIAAAVVTVRERAGRRMIRAAFQWVHDFFGGKKRELQVAALEVANFIHDPDGPIGNACKWWRNKARHHRRQEIQRLRVERQRRAQYLAIPPWIRIFRPWRPF